MEALQEALRGGELETAIELIQKNENVIQHLSIAKLMVNVFSVS